MQFIRKYGTAAKVRIPVVKASSADFSVSGDWTPATGDVKISKDGGNVGNITTLPVAVGGSGSALWEFAISATEMQAAEITIQVVDSATKAVQDQAISIITFGNASASFALDLTINQTGDSYARLGAPAGASTAADIAAVKAVDDAVKAKTDNLPESPASTTNITAASGVALTSAYDAAKTAATQTSVDDLPTNSELATALAAADDATLAQIALVKAKTDNLPSDPADASDIAAAFGVVGSAISGLNDLSQADVRTAVGLSSANLDTQLDALPTNSELTAALASADDATLAQIALVKAKTDNLPASPAATGDAMTLTAAYDAAKTAASQTSVDDIPTNAELSTALGAADDAVLARLGTPAGASLAADLAAVKSDSAAILVDTGTDLPASIAAISVPSASDIADEVEGRTLNVDIQFVDGKEIIGSGTTGDPWKPAP